MVAVVFSAACTITFHHCVQMSKREPAVDQRLTWGRAVYMLARPGSHAA
jgi:hypothetical protein